MKAASNVPPVEVLPLGGILCDVIWAASNIFIKFHFKLFTTTKLSSPSLYDVVKSILIDSISIGFPPFSCFVLKSINI